MSNAVGRPVLRWAVLGLAAGGIAVAIVVLYAALFPPRDGPRRVVPPGLSHGSVPVVAVAIPDAAPGFNPRQVVPPMPAIKEFPIISATEADRILDDAELVVGVEIDGQARAYPINMLTGPRREILNDTLAKRPVAATW